MWKKSCLQTLKGILYGEGTGLLPHPHGKPVLPRFQYSWSINIPILWVLLWSGCNGFTSFLINELIKPLTHVHIYICVTDITLFFSKNYHLILITIRHVSAYPNNFHFIPLNLNDLLIVVNYWIYYLKCWHLTADLPSFRLFPPLFPGLGLGWPV